MSLLQIDKLSLSFGETQVLKNVSFRVAKGECTAVVGESGSGKSLTALAVLGLQPPQARLHEGSGIIFDQHALHQLSDRRLRTFRGKRIGMIFQEPMTALNPLHSIGKQIGESLRLHQRLSKDAARLKTIGLLRQVGLDKLTERLGAYPHELSGGQRQRVMIAMAIANQPELLIADEPTTALDVTVQLQILDLLKQLQRDMGMALLLITHDFSVVRYMADQVVVMQQGKVVEKGKAAQVLREPKHAYTQSLLASHPHGEPQPLPNNAEPLLTCQNLSVKFPAVRNFWGATTEVFTAVDNVQFALHQGETIGIVGESGSGKTTLGMALLRLQASSGTVYFASKPLPEAHAMRAMRQQMQVVFQDPFSSLNPRMTVREIIAEGLRAHRLCQQPEQMDKRIQQVLQDVELPEDAAERYPHAFSGGQRQRIGLARALALRPQLVVLDEPTSALDISTQQTTLALLTRLQQRYGLSYLFISHDLRVIRQMSHQILVMKQGKIVERGTAEQIFTAPKHPYTQSLLQASYLETVASAVIASHT